MLRLFRITYYRVEKPGIIFTRFVLGKSACHAVNLLYREFDSRNELNVYKHHGCDEVSCLNPSIFNRK